MSSIRICLLSTSLLIALATAPVALRSPAALDPAEADSVVGGQASCTGINTKTENIPRGCDTTQGCGNVANVIQDGDNPGPAKLGSSKCLTSNQRAFCGAVASAVPKCN